jgi:predicted MFS family arabinose efflux permease
VGSFLAVGLSLLPFAFLDNMVLAFLVAMVEGVLLAPSSLAPVVASNHLPRPLWSSAFSYLNKASSIGGAIGIALSAIWLLGGTKILPGEAVMRFVFVGLAALAVLGAVWSHRSLLSSRSRQAKHPGSQRHLQEHVGLPRSTREGSIPLPLFNDQFVFFLVASFFLFTGFGMSFSGVHSYLTRELKAPLGFIMAALLVLRLFSYSVSNSAAHGLAKHFPVRMQSLAAMARMMSMLLIAAIGILAPAQVALPIVLTLVALWGLSAGVVAVSGTQSIAHLSTPGCWGQSQTLYTAVVNAGAILGAWGGGILASYFGFSPMFLIAAILTSVAVLLLMRS